MSSRIYQDIEFNCENRFLLDDLAAHHLIKVLRLKNKSQVILFNGDGYNYLAELFIDRKKAFVDIISKELSNTLSCLNITLLQGISKGDRMDVAIQKSVELGVNKIIPTICQRTVVNLKNDRAEKKHRHWVAVSIHASEQSGRSNLAEVSLPAKFLDTISSLPDDNLRITLDPLADETLQSLDPLNKDFILLIGPEGGLSMDELEYAKQNGFRGVRLGPRILRTETAALASISAIQTLWGDFKN